MNDSNSNSVDLNLLAVFCLLMRERSVSGAARQLRLGQPAVSRNLARLREALGDPLFVRAGRTMEPTPRALELYAELVPAFERIEQAVRTQTAFDPQDVDRVFSIAMSDDLLMSVLPSIRRRLSEEMPNARIVVRQTDYLQAGPALDRGLATIVVGYLDRLPANAKIKKVVRIGYRMLMSADRAVPRTSATYCSRPHVLVTFAGDLVGYIDETLAELSLQRSVVLSVPSFAVLPFLLRQSDLLATVPQVAADTLAGETGLRSARLPFVSPQFDISMAWRAATDRDPGEAMVREVIESEIRRQAHPQT